MTTVARLLTRVDIADSADEGPDARSMDVTADLGAVLSDGRWVFLLDRGWGGMLNWAWDEEPTDEERRRAKEESPGIWAYQTVDGMAETARAVVGPDEPGRGQTHEEADEAHWGAVAGTLHGYGVEITWNEVMALPHDVELSDRVLARIGPTAP